MNQLIYINIHDITLEALEKLIESHKKILKYSHSVIVHLFDTYRYEKCTTPYIHRVQNYKKHVFTFFSKFIKSFEVHIRTGSIYPEFRMYESVLDDINTFNPRNVVVISHYNACIKKRIASNNYTGETYFITTQES